MAVCTRTSLFIMTTGVLAALSACGGDDDGTPIVADAATDAAIDAIPIDAPPACNAPSMVCGGECVDVTSSNEFCGDCTTACAGGEICTTSTCDCVAPFVPAAPAGFSQMFEQSGFTIGLVLYGSTTTNAILVGISAANTQENTPYTVSSTVGTPPFIAAGYDVDISTQEAEAAYYATAGTITFTKVCPASSPAGAGFSGTLTDATFSAVESLTNPVLVTDGCSFTVPSVEFSVGDVSCTNSAQ